MSEPQPTSSHTPGTGEPPALSAFRLAGSSAHQSGDLPLAQVRYQKLAEDMSGQFTRTTVDAFMKAFLPKSPSVASEPQALRFSSAAVKNEATWVETINSANICPSLTFLDTHDTSTLTNGLKSRPDIVAVAASTKDDLESCFWLLLYMLAHYTDLLPDDEFAADHLLVQTFDGAILSAAWSQSLQTEMKGGGSKKEVVQELSRFTGHFLPPDTHHNLRQLLRTLSRALYFFSEAQTINDIIKTEENALDHLRETQDTLLALVQHNKSPQNEKSLRTVQRNIDELQAWLVAVQQPRDDLEYRKKISSPFRYGTFVEALDKARIDYETIALEDQPAHGSKKVPDRVEAVRHARRPEHLDLVGRAARGKSKTERSVSKRDV